MQEHGGVHGIIEMVCFLISIRNHKFSPARQHEFEEKLYEIISKSPCNTLPQHCATLNKEGFSVQPQFVRKTLHRWRYTFKKPVVRQIEKYTTTNIRRYANFVYGVQKVPFEKLKFLDEAHFCAKDCKKRKALGEIGEPVFVITSAKLDISFSLTLMTTLSDPVGTVIDLRTDSNTQWDFASFILFCLQKGYLTAGDYLVVDNASVHVGNDSTDAVLDALDGAGSFCLFGLSLIFI
jgi:hypothetical protein